MQGKPKAPESCSCTALRQAARHVTRLYDELLAPTGLGLTQYAILSALDERGDQVLQYLAASLVLDRSTLGHLLRPLERRGLLTMRNSTEDGRKKIVALTRQGAKLLASARPLWAVAEKRFRTAFGEVDAAGMRTMMRRITTMTDDPGSSRPILI